jgi:hypothetical protein
MTTDHAHKHTPVATIHVHGDADTGYKVHIHAHDHEEEHGAPAGTTLWGAVYAAIAGHRVSTEGKAAALSPDEEILPPLPVPPEKHETAVDPAADKPKPAHKKKGK